MKASFCPLEIKTDLTELCDAADIQANFEALDTLAKWACCLDDEVNAFSRRSVKPGDSIELRAVGGTAWSWSGPDSFASTDQNPVIASATSNHQGLYTVTITETVNGELCTHIRQEYIWVDQPVCIQDLEGNLPDASTIQEGVIFFATDTNMAKLLCGGAWIDFPIDDTRVVVNQGGPFPVPTPTGNVDRLGELFMASDNMLYYVDLNGNSQVFASTNIFNSDGQITVARSVDGQTTGSVNWFDFVTWAIATSGLISWNSAGGAYRYITLPAQDDTQDRLLVIDASGNLRWRDQSSVLGPTGGVWPFRCSAIPFVCEGDNIELFAEGPGGASYAWTGPNAFNSNSQNPTVTTVVGDAAGGTKTGRYVVTITDGPIIVTEEVYVKVVFCPAPEAFIL